MQVFGYRIVLGMLGYLIQLIIFQRFKALETGGQDIDVEPILQNFIGYEEHDPSRNSIIAIFFDTLNTLCILY